MLTTFFLTATAAITGIELRIGMRKDLRKRLRISIEKG